MKRMDGFFALFGQGAASVDSKGVGVHPAAGVGALAGADEIVASQPRRPVRAWVARLSEPSHVRLKGIRGGWGW